MEGPSLAGLGVGHGFNAVFFVVDQGVAHAVYQAGGLVAPSALQALRVLRNRLHNRLICPS